MQEDFSTYNGEGTALRRAQLRMLTILAEIDKVCIQHNIPYWIDGGTCLGAIRHGGFIPWDDDLDIALLRKDYLKLCKILRKELPDNLAFQDKNTDKYYPFQFAKVRDKHSFFNDSEQPNKIKERGIFIDIFPIERGSLRGRLFVNFFYARAFRRLRHFTGNQWEFLIACFMWPFACILVALMRTFNFLFPADSLIYGYGVPNAGRYQLSKRDFLPTKRISFENIECSAPANPDGYLRRLYKDYMQIPPPEKRQQHATQIIFYD